MADLMLEREINALKGDLNITKLAISSVQNKIREELMGSMGEDIKAVLNGDIVVEAKKSEKIKFRIKQFFKNIFRLF